MKKLISLFVAIVLIFVSFAGCGNTGQTDKDETETDQEETEVVETASETAETSDAVPSDGDVTSTGNPVTDSYTAFINAKTVPFERLSDGLSNNEDTVWSSMSLLGVAIVDLYLFPVAFFGLGEEAAAAGMEIMGAEGVQYTESGNNYTMTYTDSEGIVTTLSGAYDPATDSLTCSGMADGMENFYSEYRKTPYGYVAQYYFLNDDGTSSFYLITVQGEDGAFGISTAATEKPAALTGSEPFDYPSSCPEWYAINGSTITGMTSDGTAVNFEYVPTESAES